MREDERETDESQPKPEMHPPSESEVDENQSEQETQPSPEMEKDKGQSEVEPAPRPISSAPSQGRLPLTQQQKRRQYFIGLGVGLIPLIIFLVCFGLSIGAANVGLLTYLLYGIFAAAFLYIIELIVTIIFLVNKRLRFAGYGLLTAFLASPVVAAIGCTVIPNLIHR